jgi:hypothetical protein
MESIKSLIKFAIIGCILLIVYYSISYGQSNTREKDSILILNRSYIIYPTPCINNKDSATQGVYSLCMERRHVKPCIVMSTNIYCSSYIIDTDSITIQVYPSCNWITYTCERCGKTISEQEPEHRIVIWRKNK